MAKIERQLNGDFQTILSKIETGILGGSITASLEDASDFIGAGFRCSVRVFERYSALGSNRVSLSITLIGEGDRVYLSAITSGGSQAMFLKINTWGESSFLKKLTVLLESL